MKSLLKKLTGSESITGRHLVSVLGIIILILLTSYWYLIPSIGICIVLHFLVKGKKLNNLVGLKSFYIQLKTVLVLTVLFFSLVLGAKVGFRKITSKKVEAYISRTDREDEVYMIYTDKGVFKCVDDRLEFKVNSSDVYAKLLPGTTVTFKTTGFRNTWFSSYPNIIKVY